MWSCSTPEETLETSYLREIHSLLGRSFVHKRNVICSIQPGPAQRGMLRYHNDVCSMRTQTDQRRGILSALQLCLTGYEAIKGFSSCEPLFLKHVPKNWPGKVEQMYSFSVGTITMRAVGLAWKAVDWCFCQWQGRELVSVYLCLSRASFLLFPM